MAPRREFVTRQEFVQHHETNVKPSLNKIDEMHAALIGNLEQPGIVHRLRDVEKTHKMAKRGLVAGASAVALWIGRGLWDLLRGSHS